MRKKRQLDDPRALGEPAKGAVVFAFGLVGPGRTAIPGPALVAMLGALGFGEPTARATILRMRRDGRLESVRRGPVVEYALTAATIALSMEVRRPIVGPRPAWDGGFGALLYSVPERARAYRDQLRRAAVVAGFGTLQPGVLITTDERRWERLDAVLDSAPAGSRLTRARLAMTVEAARTVAQDAWPLAELSSRYRAQTAELLGLVGEVRKVPPEGPAAIQALWRGMAPTFAVAAEDPMLPAGLLPADWAGDGTRDAVMAATAVLGPAVGAYLDALLGRR